MSDCAARMLEPGLPTELRKFSISFFARLNSVLKDSGVQYAITGGTLLGSWRHHCLIPWDDDFDIIVQEHYRAKFLSIFNKYAFTRSYYLILEPIQIMIEIILINACSIRTLTCDLSSLRAFVLEMQLVGRV